MTTTAQASPGRPVIEARGLSKEFHGGARALTDVSFALEPNRIHGLLGRNGAGKTTLMRVLTGQDRPTSGSALVLGEAPFENASVLGRVCFVKEQQSYPDGFRVSQVLAVARILYPTWDEACAAELVAAFDLPADRRVKKLSRGMISALGIVVGIASRAPVTLFDEPYLGLDAAARQTFYHRLLADFSEHPRTVLISTHLIDEVANLLERVVVVHGGRVIMDAETDDVRGAAATVTGLRTRVEEFTSGHEVLHREALGSYLKVTVRGRLDDADRLKAAQLDLELTPVSLQQVVIDATAPSSPRDSAPVAVGGPTVVGGPTAVRGPAAIPGPSTREEPS